MGLGSQEYSVGWFAPLTPVQGPLFKSQLYIFSLSSEKEKRSKRKYQKGSETVVQMQGLFY